VDWDAIQQEHNASVNYVLNDMRDDIIATAEAMISAIKNGGKILIFGNGGSAADAQHFAAELVNRFLIDSAPYAALALTTDSSNLTSIANDYDYNEIFSKQVQALGQKGDVLVGITTSGNSPNIIKALEVGRAKGCLNVCLTGGEGGECSKWSDKLLTIKATSFTPRVQEGHLVIIHCLCEIIEKRLVEENYE